MNSKLILSVLAVIVAFVAVASAHKKIIVNSPIYEPIEGGHCPPCNCGYEQGPPLPNRPYIGNAGYGASGSYAGAVAGSYGNGGGHASGGY